VFAHRLVKRDQKVGRKNDKEGKGEKGDPGKPGAHPPGEDENRQNGDDGDQGIKVGQGASRRIIMDKIKICRQDQQAQIFQGYIKLG